MIKKEWSWMLTLPIDNNDDEDIEDFKSSANFPTDGLIFIPVSS